ncbi:hypothetical protein ES703_42604 [subsurface metagenome]
MANLCEVCGRVIRNESELCPWCFPEAYLLKEEETPTTTHVQDYLDLDAAGFLLVALGHLVKAKEKLDQEPPSRAAYLASLETTMATNHVRYALKRLDEHAKGAAQ